MTDPENIADGVHPEAALLPWYANGTLRDDERGQVARHLESCEDCRHELNELAQLKGNLNAMYQQVPGPSARLARSVMARVAAEPRTRQNQKGRDTSWLSDLDQWCRSLLIPQWVPTLAIVLLVTQMVLLLWVGLPLPERDEVSSRSIGMETTQAMQIVLAFQPSATEEQIRSLVSGLHGRLVDGPTPAGLYTIRLPRQDAAAADQLLAQLNTRHDLVRSAELIKP